MSTLGVGMTYSVTELYPFIPHEVTLVMRSFQFSSVPRPIGSSGDVTNDSVEMLFRSFLPEAIVSSSLAWAGMSTL